MRLLNTETFAFEDFMNPKSVRYAILSHRWSETEVSHKEFSKYYSGEKTGYGWTKIERACQIAASNKFKWVWIDTCCIDKDSSAELTEAINSMFQWYQRAQVCYVFLHDVQRIDEAARDFSEQPIFRARSRNIPIYEGEFKTSEWFRRGWTLQELLAPRHLEFFNDAFQCFGSRAELAGLISAASNIDYLHVCQPLSSNVLQDLSIAERMRWVSNRETTKEEDIAYCLLGLFDVNMPLLYGEGKKAFIRLQLELIKKSDDESIFAWETTSSMQPLDGLLAAHPSAFQNLSIKQDQLTFHNPHSMTNKGLQMTLDIPNDRLRKGSIGTTGIKAVTRVQSDDFKFQKEHTLQFLLPLNCTTYVTTNRGAKEAHAVAIRFQATVLKQNTAFLGVRIGPLQLTPASPSGNWLPTPKELGSAILIGEDSSTRLWTVYFPQKGL